MTISLHDISARWAREPDDRVKEALAQGSDAFTPDGWRIILEEARRRSIATDLYLVSPDSGDFDKVARGPWFIIERLAGRRWPASKELPQRYLSLLAGMAGVWTIVSILGMIALIAELTIGEYFYRYTAESGVVAFLILLIVAVSSGLVFVAASTPRPWAWYYLLCYSLANYALSPPAGLVMFPLVWLYFARRRSEFGLPPWPFVM